MWSQICALIVVYLQVASASTGSNAVTEFGHNLLLKVHSRDADKNILISPFSVHTALGMAMVGSADPTRKEFVGTLQLDGMSSDQINQAYSEMLSSRQGDHGVKLNVANRLYVAKDFEIKQNYKSLVQSTFKADALNVDFAGAAEHVKNDINAFVNSTTNGLIPQVLQAPLSQDTKVALVNSLYFKGEWVKGFKEIEEKLPFNKECSTLTSEVSTWLKGSAERQYLESDTLKAKLISLPYWNKGGGSVEMLIMVPNEENKCAFKDWLKAVKWSDVKAEMSKMKYTTVDLKMPKFEMSGRYNLEDFLPSMGLKSAFDHNASNFSGIADAKLAMSKVIHQTKMTVTKSGTEAAAATVIAITKLAFIPPQQAIPMTIDKSFYVALLWRNKEETLTLFNGVVNKP